jgi:thioredoxin-dependent peroxiredoxin
MKAGDIVSDFTLLDDNRNPRTLSELLADGPVVLFFYPMASSGGCTQEACHFRDLAAEFAALGARPVGISSDNVTKQSVFANAHNFGYPLLSDEKHKVAKELGAYRAWLPGGLHTRRLTYVIDTDRTIIDVFGSETKMEDHADQALEILRKRQAAA